MTANAHLIDEWPPSGLEPIHFRDDCGSESYPRGLRIRTMGQAVPSGLQFILHLCAAVEIASTMAETSHDIAEFAKAKLMRNGRAGAVVP